MHIDLMFPSLYLKAADLQGRDVTLTIRRVSLDELTRQGGSKEMKPVVYFKETADKAQRTGQDEKRLVLNKTNAHSIRDLYGPETDGWAGKRITLYSARVTFGRQTVDAIRVRDETPPAKRTKQADDSPDPVDDYANSGGVMPEYVDE